MQKFLVLSLFFVSTLALGGDLTAKLYRVVGTEVEKEPSATLTMEMGIGDPYGPPEKPVSLVFNGLRYPILEARKLDDGMYYRWYQSVRQLSVTAKGEEWEVRYSNDHYFRKYVGKPEPKIAPTF